MTGEAGGLGGWWAALGWHDRFSSILGAALPAWLAPDAASCVIQGAYTTSLMPPNTTGQPSHLRPQPRETSWAGQNSLLASTTPSPQPGFPLPWNAASCPHLPLPLGAFTVGSLAEEKVSDVLGPTPVSSGALLRWPPRHRPRCRKGRRCPAEPRPPATALLLERALPCPRSSLLPASAQ